MKKNKLFFLLCFFWSAGLAQKQLPLDSLLKVVGSNQLIGEKIKTYQAIIVSLWLNYPDSAEQFARNALREAASANDTYSLSIANRMMGGVQLYKGNYDSSLEYNQRSAALAELTKRGDLISASNNNIGFALYHMGAYIESLNYLMKSLRYRYELNHFYGIGLTLNNIGLNYTKLKDYKKARAYFDEALAEGKFTNDRNVELYTNNNIGFTYLLENNYSVAEEYFNKALKIAHVVTNNNWLATTYSGLAQIRLASGDHLQARALLKKSLILRQEIGERTGISEVYYFLSIICQQENKIDSAFYYLGVSHKIATSIKSKARQLQNFALYKELFLKRKRYDSSLYYMEQYEKLNNSLFNENLARSLSNLELSIVGEENKHNLDLKEIQIQRTNLKNNFLVIAVFLALIVAAVISWFYKTQKKLTRSLYLKNKAIANQSEEISQQREELMLTNEKLSSAQFKLEEFNKDLQATVNSRTKELEQANRDLKILNHEMDEFIYKSSHDMKGPLVRLLGICHVALMDVEDKKARQYFDLMKNTSLQINDIFDRLKTVVYINNLEVRKEKIYFDLLIEKIRNRLKTQTGYKDITFDILIDEGINYFSDEFLVETIFTNLISNAVRFQKPGNKEKLVKIRVKKDQSGVVVSITDNGIGIKESDKEHLFEMFSKAALEYQYVGLGLYITNQSVKKLGGTIWLSSHADSMTEFTVKLP